MPDPASIKIGALVSGGLGVVALFWRVIRDLISRIGSAHDHARQVAQTLRSEMQEQTRETRGEIQRVEGDLRELRGQVATKEDVRAVTDQITHLREDLRRRDERMDRFAERAGGGEGSR